MTPYALIAELIASGAKLRATDGKIGVRPRSVVTPELRDAIRRHRAALVEMISAGAIFAKRESVEVFEERLAIADDLEMDTSPGSEAWTVAVREANRVQAGVSTDLHHSRSGGIIDTVSTSFARVGIELSVTDTQPPVIEPVVACRACGRSDWWRPFDDPPEPGATPSPATGWTCSACHPAANPESVIRSQGGLQ